MANNSLHRYNRTSPDVIEKIRQMVEVDKFPQKKIAELLGIGKNTITRYCKRLGLKTQRTGPRSGEGHPGWKGGRNLVGRYWYVYLPDHPHATKQHSVAEHRLVMEGKLGRFLDKDEVVHHIDGDSQNNHPDNLMVFQTNSRHLKTELKGKRPVWTLEGYSKMCRAGGRFANLELSKLYGGQPPQSNDHLTS